MGLPIVVVDAFTDTRFRGNPAAVCVLPEGRDDQFMKDVAREMNLSETAFLLRDGYLVEVASEDIVRKAVPNHPLLRTVQARGVIVTSPSSSPGFDFVSRFFAPGSGIDEDPVTGSSHCALAPYWGERLGKSEMVGYQTSARGGVVRVRLHGDRVKLAGQAITVLRGELV